MSEEEIEKLWLRVKGLSDFESKRLIAGLFGVFEVNDEEGFYFKTIDFILDKRLGK